MKGAFRRMAVVVLLAIVIGLSVGCVSTGVHNYEQFRGAVDAGAKCSELYDIKSGFERAEDRARLQRDLDEIGCESRNSARTDL